MIVLKLLNFNGIHKTNIDFHKGGVGIITTTSYISFSHFLLYFISKIKNFELDRNKNFVKVGLPEFIYFFSFWENRVIMWTIWAMGIICYTGSKLSIECDGLYSLEISNPDIYIKGELWRFTDLNAFEFSSFRVFI